MFIAIKLKNTMGCSKLLLFLLFTTFASSSSLNDNIHKCSEKETGALLLFIKYHSSINTDDDSYPLVMNWNTSTDCCNWKGVTCDYSTRHVIGLDVTWGRLEGTIHPNTSLFNLPHLQKLNLAFNGFTGQFPGGSGRFLNSLTHLNLSGCSFSGQVPPDITLLHKLVSLDLSSNGYRLKLRPHVFINMLRNFTNLKALSLYAVNISSVLPMSLNMSSSMKLLNLRSTGLKGKLPYYIFNLHSLETLDLRDNSFTGDIPSEIPANLTHLTYLHLSYNQLNGTLPFWLFTFTSLKYLDLSHNMFGGNVPFKSFALQSLYILDLSYNELVGHIDMKTFQTLTNLNVLDFSYNHFSGEWELDTLLTSLKNLERLELSYNNFSVTTKNANHYVSLGLYHLGLASCKLKVIPNSLRAMGQLERLDLSNNEIYGQIPYWAGEIGGDELYHLNLSHNFITGLSQFHWAGEIEELYLQSNMIEEPFPPSICNMSNLMHLDMSNNWFGGLIPQCFGNVTSSLVMVDMGNNSFQGAIPNVYGDCGIIGLSLNGNQLHGKVPISFSKCKHLSVLDFGNNHLNGTFPNWLGDLPNLQALVLKSNNFHGNVQPSFATKFPFPSLRVLDLSHNRFVGQLPVKYFQSFISMKNVAKDNEKPKYLNMGGKYYSIIVAVKGVDQDFPQISVDYTIIDMSSNAFEGHIPSVIGGLSSLIVLNLSHNNLIGPIPHAFGNLREIESLDLSWNQLSGEIPKSLAGITTLEVLNLSQNHLVGRIPEGPQFSTFDTSFGGNSGLYGSPLPKREHQSSPKVEDGGEYDDVEKSGFTWKVVTLGYGCGTLVGLVMGYLMLSTRKVKWFNAISDAAQSLVPKKKRRHIFIGK